MIGIVKWVSSLLTGGLLDRVLTTVDKKVEADRDKEKLKADIIREYYRNRGDFMRSGGFTLMLLFSLPLAVWFSAVVIYSILWCQGCAYPQDWSIAALPSPLDEWAGAIIVSIFGVIGVSRFK